MTASPTPSPASAADSTAAEGVFVMPVLPALGYMLAATLIGLGAGLGQGFLTANLAQIAGDLGATQAEASWLIVAFVVPRCCLPIILTKVRTQFGLRRFTEVSITVYAIIAFAAVWTDDLSSTILVEVLSGASSASLSTLAFLYMLEPLSAPWRMRLGLPVALTALSMGTSLARVISPGLVGDGGLVGIHVFTLGMALSSLAMVLRLPLKPIPHAKVIRSTDLISFAFIATGFTGVITAFVMGPIRWWTDAPWIGWVLAGGCVALTIAVVIELRRTEPMLDIRWLASPAVVHLTGALLIFRLILSEQSTGAPRMFQVLGLSAGQVAPMFLVICIATAVGALACVAWIKPGREPQFHLAALTLIAAGAWLDSNATIDTRPEQMFISQAMIGFAGMLFMPPAMMAGLLSALRKGPQYILSFIVIYIATQSLGGMLGSGVFTTLINHRQALHYQQLIEQMTATSPAVSTEIALRSAAMAPQITDAASLKAQAVAQLATNAANQAYVMAYNDAYFLTFILAVIAGAMLCLHLLRDGLVVWFAGRAAPSASASQDVPR